MNSGFGRELVVPAPSRLRWRSVPAAATKLNDSPHVTSPAATGDTRTENLAELSGDGLAYAPRGTAGNRGFARSKGGFMADCAAGVKKRADAVTKRQKQNIAAEQLNGSEDLKGSSLELEP
jgi:hypothetical protein